MPAAATSRRPRWPEGVDRAHVFERIRLAIRPKVTITEPPADMVVEREVEVPVRDGTVLRVNVFRPPGPGPFPTLLSLHPYGKDALPVPPVHPASLMTGETGPIPSGFASRCDPMPPPSPRCAMWRTGRGATVAVVAG